MPSVWLLIELSRSGLGSGWGGVLTSEFACFFVGVDRFSSAIVSSLTFSVRPSLEIGRRFDDFITGLVGLVTSNASSSIIVGVSEEMGADSFSVIVGFLNEGHLGGS